MNSYQKMIKKIHLVQFESTSNIKYMGKFKLASSPGYPINKYILGNKRNNVSKTLLLVFVIWFKIVIQNNELQGYLLFITGYLENIAYYFKWVNNSYRIT